MFFQSICQISLQLASNLFASNPDQAKGLEPHTLTCMICLFPTSTFYFESARFDYLITTDRFSGWLDIYHVPQRHATSKSIISTLRTLFITYGVPEELSSDGGPQFKASLFEQFLAQWGVHHRNSSAEYPQSNGRAELGVKTAKRIIMSNT